MHYLKKKKKQKLEIYVTFPNSLKKVLWKNEVNKFAFPEYIINSFSIIRAYFENRLRFS